MTARAQILRAQTWVAGNGIRALVQAARQERETRILWLPVLFGTGIGGYFALPLEPPPALTAALGLAAIAVAVLGPKHSVYRAAAVLVLVAFVGFGLVQFRAFNLDTPVLAGEGSYQVSGIISAIDRDPRGYPRLTLDAPALDGRFDSPALKRIRVTVRTGGDAVKPGDVVSFRAGLTPPPGPVAPGAFDFARQAWFRGIGAVGYAVTPVKRVSAADMPAPGWRMRVNGARDHIVTKSRAVLTGDTGAVAAALMTGLRGGISRESREAIRIAGLAHLLAISGLHVGLFSGIVFFAIRGLLALSPTLALTLPIKAIAASGAWLAALGYLFLSGASVPTERAFLMASIVLLAVLLGRRAISMRLLALAAMVILVLSPEDLLSAGFQMSFAAVAALIAGYELLRDRLRMLATGPRSLPKRVALYFLAVIVSTIIAEIAIGPIAAFHFNRVNGYGLVANLVAVPVMTFWIMPWSVVAIVLFPFGAESAALVAMGWGIDIVLQTAHTVASWPGATYPMASAPNLSLYLFALGGLWLCLWRDLRLRSLGLIGIAAAFMIAPFGPRPDVLINETSSLIAVKGDDGRLATSSSRSSYIREVWLRRSGQDTANDWQDAAGGIRAPARCDEAGCLYATERDGRRWRIAFVFHADAMAEDCLAGALVFVLFDGDARCRGRAPIISQRQLEEAGGIGLWITAEGIERRNARPTKGSRPWAR